MRSKSPLANTPAVSSGSAGKWTCPTRIHLPPSPRHSARAEPWQQFFRHGVVPRLEALDFVARAVTPPRRLRRYDTRFFMAEAGEIAGTAHDSAASGELLTPRWVTPAEAKSAQTLRITRRVLDEVEARLSEGQDPTRPVPFYRLRHNRPEIVAL